MSKQVGRKTGDPSLSPETLSLGKAELCAATVAVLKPREARGRESLQ